MSDFDYNGWGNSPDRERLVLSKVSDTVVEVSYKPSEKQLKAVPRERPIFQVPLARFDAADETITIIPRRTRPSMSMLGKKYPWLDRITIDANPFYLPDSEDRAADELLNLPDGFMGDWTWGLGVPKINQPILDVFRQTPIKHLHFTRSGESRLKDEKFYVAMSDWRQLVADMNRITSIHQREGLSERRIVAHNQLLANSEGFERKQMPTRRNALSELISRTGPALSKTDRTSLVLEVGKRSEQIARQEPKALAALQKTIELVTLDVLIERFSNMIEDDPVEAVWQELLQTNQFLLSMVFGFPVVLIRGQGTVAGPGLDGRGQKIADFVMAHDQTNNVALVEIKRSSARLISDGAPHRDVPRVAGDLTNAIMQVLDQRARFVEELPTLRNRDRNTNIEAHAVGCVVVIGKIPRELNQQRAFEIYRASFKDVSVITFDELLARLVSLKAFLSSDPPPPNPPAAPPSTPPTSPPWSRPPAASNGDLF